MSSTQSSIQSHLKIKEHRTLTLDQGETPTHVISATKTGYKDFAGFTEPTVLTIQENADVTVETNGCLNLQDGSTLVIKSGAGLTLNSNSFVHADQSSNVCIERGANMSLPNSELGGILLEGHNLIHKGDLTISNSSRVFDEKDVFGKLITDGAGVVTNSGQILTHNVKARNEIVFRPGAKISDGPNDGLLAHIVNPIQDCDHIYKPEFADYDPNDLINEEHILGDHSHNHDHSGDWDVPFYIGSKPQADIVNNSDLLNVFPNPAFGNLTVNLLEEVGGDLTIRNALGQVLFNKKVYTPVGKIDLEHFKSGMYTITYIVNDESKTQLFTVKK